VEAYLLDWANLLVRWLHLITGVAWIGASFYFVMLDMSLRKPEKAGDSERGVFGESWAVHGGGVYHSQKYLAGPIGEPLSEHLHWSKWEAYTTWMSGIGLMAIIYWFGASTYLIDPQVKAWSVPEAIGLSIAFLVISWLVYDGLCRVLSGHDNLLAFVVFIYILACDWLLFQVFSARAAYIHVGAIMGTMMAANVFHHIIPGQKKMVAEIRAGETPNPKYGIVGKQRSVHNTYFTLPVLFIMISNHYPMTYSHPQGWIVLALMMIAGVLIRQYFVMRHVNRQKLWMPIVAVALLLALFVWLMPKPMDAGGGEKVAISEVKPVVALRCVSCHAEQPTQPGFVQPPKGVILETEEQMLQHAATIAQTVQSRYMPIGNLTGMTDDERSLVVRWASQAAIQQP
jgi:uncharacterized membrane protein